MVKNFQTRWRGILLSLIGIVTIMWLAFTDQLGLYIHPRYFVFTVVMAAFAAVFVLLAFVLPPRAEPDSHTHDDAPSIERGNGWWAAGSIVIVLATAVAMLGLPPAVLTTSTALSMASAMRGSMLRGTHSSVRGDGAAASKRK